jgi:hypothetical protein
MPVRTGLDVLEYEVRQEQAATIGRLARELRDALDALDTFDSRAGSGKTAADSSDPQRARLVDSAAYALWNFVVQRECSGFCCTEQVLKDYAVPVEVRAKMGAQRVDPLPQARNSRRRAAGPVALSGRGEHGIH